jgi:hypothetical protein
MSKSESESSENEKNEDANESEYEENYSSAEETDKKTGLTRIKHKDEKQIKHPKDVFKILVPGSNRVLICGRSGSGKTTMCLSLLTMMATPTHLIIFTTIEANPVHKSIKRWCKKKDIKYIIGYDPSEFNEIIAPIIQEKKRKDHIIILFDDFSDNKTSKDSPYNNCLLRAFSKYRNYNVSCINITPDYIDHKTTIRNSASISVLFPLQNSHSVLQWKKNLFNAFPDISNTQFQEWYNYILQHPYTFIMFCQHPQPHVRLNWDKVIWPKHKDIYSSVPDPVILDNIRATKQGQGLKGHNKLVDMARQLGLPGSLQKKMTSAQLTAFIDKASKKSQKEAGNTSIKGGSKAAPKKLTDAELDEILKIKKSKASLLALIGYNTRRYRQTDNESYLDKVALLGKELVDAGYYTKTELRNYLENHGINPEE